MTSNFGPFKKKMQDNRRNCRYGTLCYQSNPDHLKRFKHPPRLQSGCLEDEPNNQKRKNDQGSSNETPSKRRNVSKDIDEDTDGNKSPENQISSEEPTIKKKSPSKEKPVTPKKTLSEENTVTAEEASGEKTSETAEETSSEEVPVTTEEASSEEKSKVIEETSSKVDPTTTEETLNKEEPTTKEIISDKPLNSDTEEKEVHAKDEVDPEKSVNSKNETQETVEKDKPTMDTNNKKDENAKKKASNVKENVPLHKAPSPIRFPTDSETAKNNNEKEKEKEKEIEIDYTEAKELITELFLVGMPADFYKFYTFCSELNPNDPATAFKFADLKLVGPYDILNKLVSKENIPKEKWLSHWRYYYDPPEFQTIVKGNDKEGLHFGYWRDRPSSDPVFVATNCSNVSHKIKPVAENIFGAITNYLEEKVKKANPFEKPGYFNLVGKLKAYAKKNNIVLDAVTPKMKSREKNVVARTIHGAGIVCPYNKKTQVGYRELSISDSQLLKIVKKIDDANDEKARAGPRAELSEVLRLATIAGDECDFGTCLELGHDLWSTGCVHVQNAALAMMSIAYGQLERQAFLKIFEAHLANRKKGCNCSSLANDN